MCGAVEGANADARMLFSGFVLEWLINNKNLLFG